MQKNVSIRTRSTASNPCCERPVVRTRMTAPSRWSAFRLGLESLERRNMLAADPAFANDLVHHWSFDEGRDWHNDPFDLIVSTVETTDFVSGANAALVNMGPANWVSGRQFSALEFDGQDDHLDVGVDLAATLGDSAALSFWLKTTDTGTLSPGDSPGVTGVLGTDQAGTQWGWIDLHGRINFSVDGVTAATSEVRVNDNQWHHIVITRDAATGNAQIHVDAQLSGQGTAATGLRATAFSSLGRLESVSGHAPYFSGRLDHIHVFDTVIGADTIQTLFTNQSPVTYDGDSKIISPARGTNAAPFSTHSATMGFAYDLEFDSLSIASYTQPANGTVTPSANGDGSFLYSANTGFSGQDSFRVVVTDGNGGFRETTLSVTVSAASASNQSATTSFTDFERVQAGGIDINFSTWTVPLAIDWNADGLQDILVGGMGSVWLYLNTGTTTSPAFGTGSRVLSNGSPIDLGTSHVGIALGDLNGDGVDDLVASSGNGFAYIYTNTSAANQTPVFGRPQTAKNSLGINLTISNQRIEIGDFNKDGRNDIIIGSSSAGISVHENIGTTVFPRFAAAEQWITGSYNLYPRARDLNLDGSTDLIRGINWGSIKYWLDVGGENLLDTSLTADLSVTDSTGTAINMHATTDGAIVDLADFNGDGVSDLLVGAHRNGAVHIAYGVVPIGNLDAIEAIYDAHLNDLGNALSANDDTLLNQVNELNTEFINWAVYLSNATDRKTAYDRLAQHINRYPQFLKIQTLDTDRYHHLPSIAAQNWMTLNQLGPNTLTHRTAVADTVGVTGLQRQIFLDHGLVIGDGMEASDGQLSSIQTYMQNQPGVLFPDTLLLIDHFFGDGSGGRVDPFTSNKNVFRWEVGGNGQSEWRADLADSILEHLDRANTKADPFTYVVGHEGTHSADKYVRGRANADLERRWAQMLMLAGGPDIVADEDGWYNRSLTQAHWADIGLWDEAGGQEWDDAYTAYWETGAGSAWQKTSFMRGNIDGFLNTRQESLATQGNQHWADSEGRIVGAIDRFYEGENLGIEPMKANISEVLFFLDLQSAGMNKVKMYDIDAQLSPRLAIWDVYDAQLERNDLGYITRVAIEDRWYEFTVDSLGIVTDVSSNVIVDADFNNDNQLDCLDVNALTAAILSINPSSEHDVNRDGLVNRDDLNRWLVLAGEENLGPDRSLTLGDANLDGVVDQSDFAIWNANRFTASSSYCSGDFNADGFIDTSDFDLWNRNRTIVSIGGQTGEFESSRDVNQDGIVSAIDALQVINFLNADADNPTHASDTRRSLDVNSDGDVTPMDALLVINYLNAEPESVEPVGSATETPPYDISLPAEDDDDEDSKDVGNTPLHDAIFATW